MAAQGLAGGQHRPDQCQEPELLAQRFNHAPLEPATVTAPTLSPKALSADFPAIRDDVARLANTERLAKAGIEPSVGSVGDSYDNALAETINGLYKAEVIHRRGPWRSFEAVEFATLEWVDWFNNRCLLKPIKNRPPAEAEAAYAQIAGQATDHAEGSVRRGLNGALDRDR